MYNVFIKREYDYAIRICAYLASHYLKEAVPIPQICRNLFISRPYVNKIVHQLKHSGVLLTTQGKFGGVNLKIDPRKLSFLDVLTAMGFNSTLNECVINPNVCPLVVICHIHEFWAEQEEKLLDELKKRKIADYTIRDEDLAVFHKQYKKTQFPDQKR